MSDGFRCLHFEIPLIIVLLLLLCFVPAESRSMKNEINQIAETVQVPVFFISDRRPKRIEVGDWTADQLIGAQNISFGVIDVPKKVNKLSNGKYKLIGNQSWDTSRNKRSQDLSVRQQLDKSLTSQMLNFGAGGGKVTPFTLGTIQNELILPFKKHLDELKSRRFILFVHGCCTPVEDSFDRAAELSISTGLPVLMFDWATPGKYQAPYFFEFNSYRRSERVLEISQHNFFEFMTLLSISMEKKDCILIGHSMGNRLICTDLLQRCSRRDFFIEQVHLVRPDLSLPAFILQEQRICAFAKRVYVYMANNDPELSKSEWLSAKVPRLGQSGKFFDLAIRLGSSFDRPSNRYLIDVSSLKLKHKIPFALVSHVIHQGLRPNEEFQFFPWKENRQILLVK